MLIFSGEDHTVAPPFQHADLHYNATPTAADKVLFEVANSNHSVANTPNGGGGSVGKIALSWLKLYEAENDRYCPLLTDNLLVNPTAASKVEQELAIGIYPNPTNNIVNLEVLDDIHFELILSLGQRILKGDLTGDNKQIDLSQFPEGMYYL